MQAKTTLRYLGTPARMAIFKKTTPKKKSVYNLLTLLYNWN